MIEKEDLSQITLTNQMKSTASSFMDGTWKKKQNKMLFENMNDLYLYINNIIEFTLDKCSKHDEQVVEKKK